MLQHANIARNAFRPIRLVRPSNLKWETNLSMGRFLDVVCYDLSVAQSIEYST